MAVRRHEHAGVLAGLEPDYRAARAEPPAPLPSPRADTLPALPWLRVGRGVLRRLLCPDTRPQLLRKRLEELGLEGGNAVPPMGKGTLALLPQIPKPQHSVVVHLKRAGCVAHVPSKVVPSKIPHEQQVTSPINYGHTCSTSRTAFVYATVHFYRQQALNVLDSSCCFDASLTALWCALMYAGFTKRLPLNFR